MTGLTMQLQPYQRSDQPSCWDEIFVPALMCIARGLALDVYNTPPRMNTTLWILLAVCAGSDREEQHRTCGTRSMIRKQVVIMGRVMASAGGVVEVGFEALEVVLGVPVGVDG
jgi:hypothetical protein